MAQPATTVEQQNLPTKPKNTFSQTEWEAQNPDKALAAAKTIAANKKMASPTFTPQGTPEERRVAKTEVRPDGTIVVEDLPGDENTNEKMAVAKALEQGGTTQPTPPAFNPEIDSTVFGDAAVQRQNIDNTFLENRNTAIANSIRGKLGESNIQHLSDSDIKKAIVQDLAQKGAPLDDPRILDTIYDIQGRVRQGQTATKGQVQNTGAPKTSTDYFNDLTQGIPLSTGNADAQNAAQRYAKFSTYSVMNANELADSINNKSIIPGDQTWTDLVNAGQSQKLQQAQQLTTFQQTQRATSSVYPVLTTDPNVSLSVQTITPPQQTDIFGALMTNIASGMNTNFAALYKQMVVGDPLIAKQRENVVMQQGKVAEIENQIASLQNELKNQIISSGGVVTDGYLASLLAERTQPLERQLATANIQLGVSTNLLNMNMQLAQQTLSFAQQDFANKQASMQLITQIATSQAQLQQQAALAKQFVPESQFQSQGVFNPITGQFTQTPGSAGGAGGTTGTGGGGYTVDSQGNYDFSSIDNPWYGKNDTTMGVAANRNNPGNIKDPKTGDFKYFDTFQEGWEALVNQVRGNQTLAANSVKGQRYNPDMTLTEYFDIYDEPGKGAGYAKSVSQTLGIPINSKIKDVPTEALAQAIFKKEASPAFYNHIFGGSPAAQTAIGTNPNGVASKYGVDASQLASLANGSTSIEEILKDPRNVKKATAYQNAAREINPNWTPQTFQNIQDFISPTGGNAKAIGAINTMYHHVKSLEDTYDQLENSNLPWWNMKTQQIAKSVYEKDPNYQALLARFDAVKNYLNTEQVKAGGGGLSLEEVQEASKLLNSAQTPAQFKGAVEGITDIVNGKTQTLADQWKQLTNAPLPDMLNNVIQSSTKSTSPKTGSGKTALDLLDWD